MPTKEPRRRPQHLDVLVKQAMAKRRITTHQLADDLAGRVNRATLYNWLNGTTKRIGSDKLAEIFAALNMTVVSSTEDSQ
jgi:hypothetical protein